MTGGGDCPGLNAVIRAVVRKSIVDFGHECVGIMQGWKGLVECLTCELNLRSISGILPRGGTILGTSRTNPFSKAHYKEHAPQKILDNWQRVGLDALIAVGGDDTHAVSYELSKMGLSIVGVPKTIDNDIRGTEYTFGFDTAVHVASEAIDRVHSTAESHHRVIVVEVMGRRTGWIALYSGIAGGADVVIVPEFEVTLAEICDMIKKRHARGKSFSICVVAEGARINFGGSPEAREVTIDQSIDEFGNVRLGGIGQRLAREIERELKFETRFTVLGHVQRGGTPTAFDRVLGTRFGIKAAELVHKRQFGRMVALQNNEIVSIPFSETIGTPKYVTEEWYDVARTFFG